MAPARPTVLIVDDDPLNLKLMNATLGAHGLDVIDAKDGLEALELLEKMPVSAVISDARMPRLDGFALCAEIRSQRRFDRVPFVLYSSTCTEPRDEDLANELGADDFIRKPARPAEMAATIRRLTHERREPGAIKPRSRPPNPGVARKPAKRSAELMRKTAGLNASEARLRAILDAEPDAVQVLREDGVITEINRAGLELFEVASVEEMEERSLFSWTDEEHHLPLLRCLEKAWSGEKATVEFRLLGSRGTRRWLELHATPLRDGEERVCGVLGLTRDLTVRKQLEGQLIQSQKMEIMGQLTSGVAHDFNNLLAVIMGCAEVMSQEAGSNSAVREMAASVLLTADRAAALTRQLLLFNRNAVGKRQRLDMRELLDGMDSILRRLLGERINLVTVVDPDTGAVEIDASQVEQVILNLCINARDAMPKGGIINISCGNLTVEPGQNVAELPPGEYVRFSVADNGEGIPHALQGRIFDPFFTTKPAGVGTGLGLATCRTIARAWQGGIAVRSTPAMGTIFSVYLPRAAGQAEARSISTVEEAFPRGSEALLVVEDEPNLLEMAAAILERVGYTVHTATDGSDALRFLQTPESERVCLVLTDLVMPVMGGQELAAQLREQRPEIRVLFSSGYSDIDPSGDDESLHYLPKPYTPSLLTRRVREVLDQAKG